MKALLSTILIISVLFMGCASSMVVNGTNVPPYGLFNQGEKQDSVTYKTSTGSLLWGIVGIESIILPIYCWGFDLYQPIGLKDTTQKTDRQK